MKSSSKKIIMDNVLSTLIGFCLYLVIIFVFPSIKVNSTINIALFVVCFLLGGLIYNLVKKPHESK